MIKLQRKEDCCGCSACQQVCPVKCISMHADREGFLYPTTDEAICIDCHLCEKICPVINAPRRGGNIPASSTGMRFAEPRVFAMRSRDDSLIQKSSSGGIFTMLAEQTIARGGVVFGARWNDDFSGVVHDFAETLEGIAKFRGSKYLQSDCGNAFSKARELLLAGREVLFTGTPCEIAGLKRFLRRDFANLLAVDIACWKVPSPLVWREFISEKIQNLAFPRERILDIRHRKKSVKNGVPTCADLSIESETGTVFQTPLYGTAFGKGFASGLITRPSCTECPAKPLTSGSDLTLGDFWGIEKTFPDLSAQTGISVAVAHNARGFSALEAVFPQCEFVLETKFENAAPYNGGLRDSAPKNPAREHFWDAFCVAPENSSSHMRVLEDFTRTPFLRRVRNFCARILKKCVPAKTINFLRSRQ